MDQFDVEGKELMDKITSKMPGKGTECFLFTDEIP